MSNDPQNKHTRREFLHSLGSALGVLSSNIVPDPNVIAAILDPSRAKDSLTAADITQLQALVDHQLHPGRYDFTRGFERYMLRAVQGTPHIYTDAEIADCRKAGAERNKDILFKRMADGIENTRQLPVYKAAAEMKKQGVEKSLASLEQLQRVAHETIADDQRRDKQLPQAFEILRTHSEMLSPEKREFYDRVHKLQLISGMSPEEFFENSTAPWRMQEENLDGVRLYLRHYKAGTLDTYAKVEGNFFDPEDCMEFRRNILNHVGKDYQPRHPYTKTREALDDIQLILEDSRLVAERMGVRGPKPAVFRIVLLPDRIIEERFGSVFVDSPPDHEQLKILRDRVRLVDNQAVTHLHSCKELKDEDQVQPYWLMVQTGDETLIKGLERYVDRSHAGKAGRGKNGELGR